MDVAAWRRLEEQTPIAMTIRATRTRQELFRWNLNERTFVWQNFTMRDLQRRTLPPDRPTSSEVERRV